MNEKIPEPFPEILEDESPERQTAISELRRVNDDVAAWVRQDPNGRSRAALLHGAIVKAAETKSIENVTAWLRYFLDNEAPRRDFDSGFYNPKPEQ